MITRSNKAGDMSHVYHKISTHLIADLPEFLKVDLSCISTGTSKYHLGPALECYPSYFVIIYKSVIINTIMNAVEILT